MRNKWIVAIAVVILLLALGLTKHFTMIFDNKANAMIVNKDWGAEAEDLKSNIENAENIIIAEVYEVIGNKKYNDIPYSLYKARITLNIKGRLLDDPIIAVPGGYYKDHGKLKLLRYNNQELLKINQVYRFIAKPALHEDWLLVTPNIGIQPLNSEKEKWDDVGQMHSYLGLEKD